MSILKVARMGHPVLRTRARAIDLGEVRSAAFQTLIDDMIATMLEYEGIGLAGPQVHEGVRLFVAGIENEHEKMRVLPFINPVITPIGEEKAEGWEGCLSIPDIRGKVPRHTRVNIKALDRRGQPFELDLSDFAARVVQHETDHLDGVLFFDRIRDFQSLAYLEEYARYHAEQTP
ncbi:MAG: peptide deformylase [Luteitalea sp.]|nr:peptide deformylase [Luteitalea sp.]